MGMGRLSAVWLVTVFVLSGTAALPAETDHGKDDATSGIEFRDLEGQTKEFIGYSISIVLSAEQERIKKDALSSIPAPCCSRYSIATCCCPCNLARSVWGLANYLIGSRHFDAARVRQAVQEWLRFTNHAGYTGDACFRGGCNRPFRENGCGGMKPEDVRL